MATSLRLHVCGVLAVQADGTELREEALPGRLGRRLWAYLVLARNRPVARDELATALRLLMRAHASKGDRAEAVHVMEECRAALGSSGLGPSTETERVFRETVGVGAAHHVR